MKQPKIGLLPLYIKLYDDCSPQYRPLVEKFYENVTNGLKTYDLEVLTVPVCRIEAEFAEAVAYFEREKVNALVTLHLAYSPSLESANVLKNTKLPLIVLDTTPDYEFKAYSYADGMNYNHGIHGVQDMCNLLRRNKKEFEIFAGHYIHSTVLEQVANAAKGALLAQNMKKSRVGIVGEPFAGMGDFRIAYDELKETLGMEVVPYDFEKAFSRMTSITQEELDAEYTADGVAYDVQVSKELHNQVSRVSLSVRKWLQEEKLTAFTMNFLAAAKDSGFPYMPFAEASKAMANGIGYAGEGDVLTAGFVGALLSVYPETSFVEMFCPDWEGNSVFLSHMGEYNVNLSKGKPRMIEKEFVYTDADNPIVLLDTFRAGKSVFVNLAPDADGKYTLLLACGEMLDIPQDNTQNYVVNGWFQPERPLAEFLAEYSRNGGIHHAAMVYGGDIKTLSFFGKLMGWNVVQL